MAANPSYDTGFASNGSEYAGTTLIPNSGYLRVTVAPTGATVDYVRSFLAGRRDQRRDHGDLRDDRVHRRQRRGRYPRLL
jgi:hypothetical protein